VGIVERLPERRMSEPITPQVHTKLVQGVISDDWELLAERALCVSRFSGCDAVLLATVDGVNGSAVRRNTRLRVLGSVRRRFVVKQQFRCRDVESRIRRTGAKVWVAASGRDLQCLAREWRSGLLALPR